MEMLANFGLSVISASLAAMLAVGLSLRQFYRQRLWEKKLDAYTALIEGLHHMRRSLESDFNASLEHREVAQEHKDELDKKYKAGWSDVERLTDMGRLLFSQDATDELRTLHMGLRSAGNKTRMYFDYLDESLAAVNKALQNFIPIAKRDLDLTWEWLPWRGGRSNEREPAG